ncbi:MAG TPA: MBL fold metallo-hydrolase, partial [Legionellales bacterium]|nr:MBL fold metallo-hydrolase [Legionellales bacterium]
IQSPKIIISASGMLSGGRILHHLKCFGPNPKNTILITGYQAVGTRGARLLNHETRLKIHGEMVDIRAQIIELTSTSAHADYEEILE